MQTQERDLRDAQDQAAQSSAKAMRVQETLHKTEAQLRVLAEDDQDLRDKVPHAKLPASVYLKCIPGDMKGIVGISMQYIPGPVTGFLRHSIHITRCSQHGLAG